MANLCTSIVELKVGTSVGDSSRCLWSPGAEPQEGGGIARVKIVVDTHQQVHTQVYTYLHMPTPPTCTHMSTSTYTYLHPPTNAYTGLHPPTSTYTHKHMHTHLQLNTPTYT